MKKLLLVLAIGAFVACNDAGTGEGEKKADSTATQTAPPDSSTVAPDSTKVDSSAVKVDTTVKK